MAPGAQANAPTRLDLIGPEGNANCETGQTWGGQADGFGTVTIDQVRNDVTALVSITGGQPNTTYHVRLIQTTKDIRDCHTGDVPVTTTASGTAHLRVGEGVLPDATGFLVSVNTGGIFGAPHWISETFVPRS